MPKRAIVWQLGTLKSFVMRYLRALRRISRYSSSGGRWYTNYWMEKNSRSALCLGRVALHLS